MIGDSALAYTVETSTTRPESWAADLETSSVQQTQDAFGARLRFVGIVPRGTVTFLFTDVEGSTRLWEDDGEAMRLALAAHDGILRSVIDAHGGYVFSTAGDAFCAAFSTPGQAVGAAVEAQRRLEAYSGPVALRVRMGLHTGTAEEREGDYFGPAVNRAARVMSAGHGGQVLLSLVTEELLRDRLPDDVSLVELGEHDLVGLSRPERLFQAAAPGLGSSFPMLRTGRTRVGNVVAAVTSFVGHAEELARLVAELPARPMVTLTGVGGVGKTRLATEAARAAADEFADGVWLCELAPVADADAVAHAVATTLAVRRPEGLSMLDSVVDALRGRRLLLILDNCEHVLDAAAELALRVTASCPTVALLATSREPVGVAAERVWAVPSLDAAVEGVKLFCDRAAAADAAFSPTDADRAIIAGICRRLDGIPLGIELAAAQVRSMTPTEMADRLDDRFRLLRGGRRGGLERHQTLRATVQWSHQLLTGQERALFDRLAVFAGGFDLDSAEAVCTNDTIDPLDVRDLLAALVDKSMVEADRHGPHTRYRLLETLRQYGEECLAEDGTLAPLRDRHLDHYVATARTASRQAEGTGYVEGTNALEVEWDNFRAALQWASTTGDAGRAGELLGALHFFGTRRLRSELGEWADQILELGGAGADVYGVAASFASQAGDQGRALRLAQTGLAAPTGPTRKGLSICLETAARVHWFSGHVAEGWAAVNTWDATADPAEDPGDAVTAALFVATFAVIVDPPSATAHLARARRIAGPLANPALDTHIAYTSGLVERAAGHYDVALGHFRQSMELAVRTGSLLAEELALVSLAVLAAMTDSDETSPSFHEALTRLLATRTWVLIWVVMEALALYWSRVGQGNRPPCSSAISKQTTSATHTSSSNAAKPSLRSGPAATPRTASHAAPPSDATSSSHTHSANWPTPSDDRRHQPAEAPSDALDGTSSRRWRTRRREIMPAVFGRDTRTVPSASHVVEDPLIDVGGSLPVEEVADAVHDHDVQAVGRSCCGHLGDLHADAPVGAAVQAQARLRRDLSRRRLEIVEGRIETDAAQRSPVVAEGGGQVRRISQRRLEQREVLGAVEARRPLGPQAIHEREVSGGHDGVSEGVLEEEHVPEPLQLIEVRQD